METFKEKSEQELEKMNTKNLLAYYKAERKRYWSFYNTKVCDCCGEIIGDKEFIKQAEHDIQIREIYLNRIKSILSKREHVKKNNLKITHGNNNTKKTKLHRSRVR